MKVCSRCKIEKEDSVFRTLKYKDRVYLHSYCNDCTREYQIERNRKLGVRKQKRKLESIPDLKTCSRCKAKKGKSDFRVRVDKRSSPHFAYLNSTCLKCDAEKTAERSRLQRSTPEGRAMHNKWANEFHKRHREKCIELMKSRRGSDEYKKMMKEYRLKNKDKIYQQEVITKRRYHEKNRDAVTDAYVINQLVNQGVADKDGILSCPGLIEAKRLQILIKRKIRNNE